MHVLYNNLFNYHIPLRNNHWQFSECMYLSSAEKGKHCDDKKPLHELWLSAKMVRFGAPVQLAGTGGQMSQVQGKDFCPVPCCRGTKRGAVRGCVFVLRGEY